MTIQRDPPPPLQKAIPEAIFWRDHLGVSPAQGRIMRDTDAAYPHAMQTGVNRRSIGDVDGAEYQEALRMRALAERRKPKTPDPKKAAAKSAEVRTAKAKARIEAKAKPSAPKLEAATDAPAVA